MNMHTDNRTGPIIQRASSFFFICLGLFVLVGSLVLIVSTLFPTDQAGTHRLVARFEGDGPTETDPFVVADGWEFRWEHDAHLQQLIWRRSDGEEDMLMEMPGKPIRKHGGVNIPTGGEYRIQVIGTGPWKVEVYQF